MVDARVRGDFGLPSELPPARPRIDSATYELREGLHRITREIRGLNERLTQLTSTHWDLQQEAEQLRREIRDAEVERDAVRNQFEAMCASLKESVAALTAEVEKKNLAVAAARAENERMRRGVTAISETARDRRQMVERALRRDDSYTQPPLINTDPSRSAYVPIGSAAPVMQRMAPAEATASPSQPQLTTTAAADRSSFAVGGGPGDGRWR
jgi:regulator of replication initiation timing